MPARVAADEAQAATAERRIAVQADGLVHRAQVAKVQRKPLLRARRVGGGRAAGDAAHAASDDERQGAGAASRLGAVAHGSGGGGAGAGGRGAGDASGGASAVGA